MADNDGWHYSNGDQKLGPVSSADLKQLAAQGGLAPSDLIWKTDWPEWKRADSLKGLFPQRAPGNGPPALPPRAYSESYRAATDAAEQVSQKLWFLDLKFERFATPKLIGFVFTAFLVCLVLLAGAVAAYTLLNYPALQAAFIIALDLFLLALLAISVRVYLELCLLGFRMVEHLSYLRHLQKNE